MRNRDRSSRWALCIAVGLALGGNGAVCAQAVQLGGDVAAVGLDEKRTYRVAPGALAGCLLQFGRQSGLQLQVAGELTQGLASPGLEGSYTSSEALTLLLAGTTLKFRYLGQRTVQIYPGERPALDGKRALGAVRVEGLIGAGGGAFALGGNGSRDLTATEGSGSLNSPLLTLGSKAPTTVRETPQTVSVMTQEQLQQQGIKNLDQAMERATGITVQQGESAISRSFWSRGYQITSLLLDGGSPIDIGGTARTGRRFQPFFDMSMYDHVEVLRGADGLFGGSGKDPAGTVNLVRKKPLEHFQTVLETQAGSWDNYRGSLDVTGPLGFDGRLRGRGVVTWQNRDFFYDTVHSDSKLAFGSLELDLSDSTLLEVGGSHTRLRGVDWWDGLPFYQDGRDPGFSRRTALTYDWSTYATDTRELFANLRQGFGEHWTADLRLTHLDQRNDLVSAGLGGYSIPLPPEAPELYLGTFANRSRSTQAAADFSLNGNFEVLGLPQKVLLGGNYLNVESTISAPAYLGDGLFRDDAGFPEPPLVAVLPFDRHDPPRPGIPSGTYAYDNLSDLRQWGLYGRVEISPWRPLHLIGGLRLDGYRTEVTDYQPDYDSDTPTRLPNRSRASEKEFQQPYYAVRLDLGEQWSLYGSYTDVYQPQLYAIGLNGAPIAPVTGSNYEAGIKFASSDGLLNASLAAYRIEREGVGIQLMRFNPDSGIEEPWYEDLGGGRSGYYRNSTTPDLSRGLDLEVTGSLAPFWQLSLGYTYNINQEGGAVDPETRGRPLQSFIPRHTLKLWNSFQLSGNPYLNRTQLGVGVRAQTYSQVSGLICNDDFVCTDYDARLPSHAVYSARAAYRIDERWSLALNLDNLFDKRYFATAGSTTGGYWYGEPRNLLLTLTGTFN